MQLLSRIPRNTLSEPCMLPLTECAGNFWDVALLNTMCPILLIIISRKIKSVLVIIWLKSRRCFKFCALLRSATVDSSASQHSHSHLLLVCVAPFLFPGFFLYVYDSHTLVVFKSMRITKCKPHKTQLTPHHMSWTISTKHPKPQPQYLRGGKDSQEVVFAFWCNVKIATFHASL